MSLAKGALTLAAVVLAASTAAQDWKGAGRLEGRVLDVEGKPIAEATVKLDLPARGGGATVKTDKKGRWALGGIAAGGWNIDFEAAGYAPKKVTVTLPSESTRIPPIEVKLEKAGALGPSPEVMQAIQKGDAAYKEGRYPEARVEYERLLTLRPDLAMKLHELIARCYSQEENYAKELEHLQLLLDADPSNVILRSLMAQEALKGGMLDRGMALLQGIDEATIKDPNVFFNIGILFLNQGKTDAAVPYFTKAVTVDPSYLDGYFQRALAYLNLQRLAESKADFRKVLELAPEGSAQAETAKKALAQIQ